MGRDRPIKLLSKEELKKLPTARLNEYRKRLMRCNRYREQDGLVCNRPSGARNHSPGPYNDTLDIVRGILSTREHVAK